MKIIQTELAGCLVIEPTIYRDTRGLFFENWHAERYAREAGIARQFVQSNVSCSQQGVLRGLHYQWPQPQGKLVSVLQGEVYDVAVDIRRGSPQFGRSTAVLLSGTTHRQFWIPEGFAHGFAVVSDEAIFSYSCTDVYQKEYDACVRWNDGALAIDWPIANPLLSDKDAAAPLLAQIPAERLPLYSP